ncbi:hypothetical protein QT327_10610 [Olivibacter sp. 47]|uniref:hypothetical protein n=1 Tax=Olivibacter sp. 47 TaxID=3056486 RepID=UPI0025A4A501|nr:hypothetical protein [Olivibacter sp. 47]MDM8174801.1 hypothetical protein [Olivibacter sp. 47]
MKAIIATIIGIVLLTNPIGKAAISPLKESQPLEEMASKANLLKNKVEELDSLLSTPR